MRSILVLACLPAASALLAQDAPRSTAQFYFASYPAFLVQFDPATDEVVRKIPFQHGMPWGVTLAHDRRRFFVVTDQQRKVEVVDLDAGAVTSVHDFAEEGVIVRVRSVQELPGGTHWYVRTERVKKHLDRYSFEPNQVLLYDVAGKKVEKKLRRLPEALSRGARISPDGRYWHVFDRDGDLQVLEPDSLREIAKIDLGTPLFAGMGRLQLGRTDLFDGRNPKMYRMLCTLSDRVQRNRTVWGYVDIDLEQNKIAEVVEWGVGPSGFGTHVARDAKVAVASAGGFGGGSSSDRMTRIALYSLDDGRKIRETTIEMRPRQQLAGIAPDGSKFYVGGAGSDFQVYDTATMTRLRAVEFDGEIYGQIHVLDR